MHQVDTADEHAYILHERREAQIEVSMDPQIKQVYGEAQAFPRFDYRDPLQTQQVIRTIRQQAKAFCEDHTLGMLYELARGYWSPPTAQGYVVELGSMQGGSTCALAMGVRDSGSQLRPVIAVDCYGWPDPALPKGVQHSPWTFNYIAARETYWKLDLAWDFVCQVIIRSDVFPKLWNRPIRVLFIDTSHVYELTLAEIHNHLPYMVEDGWIVFDDYDPRSQWGPDGVIPAVNQWLTQEKGWELEPYGGDGAVAVHLKRRIPRPATDILSS
jgi:hypothetical protein